MSASLQPKLAPTMSTQQRPPLPAKRREIHLSMGNLVAMWSVTAVLMVVVFFLGLHAGMEQGLKTLLEEQSSAAVRLPVMPLENQVQLAASSGSIDPARPSGDGALAGARGLFAADGVGAIQGIKPASSPAEEQFDFTQSAAPPAVEVAANVVGGAATAPVAKMEKAQPLVAEDLKTSAAPSDELVGSRNVAEQPRLGAATPEQMTLEIDGPPKADTVAPKITPPAKIVTAKVVAPKVVAPKEQQVKKTPPALKASAPTKGFYVQVSAPRSRSEAESAMRRVLRSGVPAQIQETKVGQVSYYRVIAGPRKTRKDADALKGRLVSSGSKESFVRFIGE